MKKFLNLQKARFGCGTKNLAFRLKRMQSN